MTDFASMNDILLDSLGEDVVLHVFGTDVPARGEFRAAYSGNNINGLPIDIQTPRLLMDSAAASAAGVTEGNTVTVRGGLYTIAEIDSDETGMTRLVLAKYAS
jgi:hypothetical protein